MKTTLRALALVALLASAGSFLMRQALPPRLVFRSPGQETQPEGVTVRGLVLHDGAPVGGARVRLVPVQERRGILVTSPFSVSTETDSEGRFELKRAPEGPAKLSVVSDRYAPALETIDVSKATPDVTVTLETGQAIESRVEADSTPVAGATVTVRLVGHDFAHDRRPFREVATDADGRFRLEGFDPSRPFRFVILAEGRRPFEKSFATPQEAPALIDLETGIRISGRVVTTSGDPVEGVELTAGQGEGYAASTRSGTSGDVEFGGLISRPVTIRAQAKGFAPARLDLPSPASGWTLVVRRNGGVAGRAPAAAWLVIESSGATYRRSVAADGSFRWEGLPPGPAEARATDSRGAVLATKRLEIPEGSIADGFLLAP